MRQRYCALTLGILFTLLGIAGFIPNFLSMPSGASHIAINDSTSIYTAGFSYIFGLFPTNLMHNIVHLIVGILGIVWYASEDSARLYNRGFAIAYAAIALMGLIPIAQTTFGLMPIYGNNVWFNALTAAIAAYFGFFSPTEARDMSPARNM